ncbi:hypothetical protein [Mesorhizobium sp. B2-4-6]|uniref:hypothetical protein n=1 Tax=Mesorhizobium sp. B2-4-6 TaxID=2589943 RepID=UPI001FEECCC5|nr:hypothetical protein [Mesorhizobium sp. B2-4-6]
MLLHTWPQPNSSARHHAIRACLSCCGTESRHAWHARPSSLPQKTQGFSLRPDLRPALFSPASCASG